MDVTTIVYNSYYQVFHKQISFYSHNFNLVNLITSGRPCTWYSMRSCSIVLGSAGSVWRAGSWSSLAREPLQGDGGVDGQYNPNPIQNHSRRFIEDQEEKKERLVAFFRKNITNKWVQKMTFTVLAPFFDHFQTQVQHLFLWVHLLWGSEPADSALPFPAHTSVPPLQILPLRIQRKLSFSTQPTFFDTFTFSSLYTSFTDSKCNLFTPFHFLLFFFSINNVQISPFT